MKKPVREATKCTSSEGNGGIFSLWLFIYRGNWVTNLMLKNMLSVNSI